MTSTAAASDTSFAAWLAHVGRPEVACDEGLRFSNAVLTIEAAMAGLGVALGRTSLVRDELAAGRLVAPFSPAVPTIYSYWLVTLPELAEVPRIAAFRAWLLEEAHQFLAGQ